MYRRSLLAVSSFSLLSVLFLGGPAWADASSSIESYLTKMILAVALLGGVGFLLVRWGPKRVRSSRNGLEVLTSLSLGRGVLYVVRCGPDILLLAESKEGISLIRRYPGDAWEKFDEVEPKNTCLH